MVHCQQQDILANYNYVDTEQKENSEEVSNELVTYVNTKKKYSESKFDIWALYKLHTLFFSEIKTYNLNSDLEHNIIEYERQKIKICRYILDSNYSYKIVTDGLYILIHHLWNNYLFDIDYFSQETNQLISNKSIEYTLANIFDIVLSNVVNGVMDLNDHIVLSIVINTYPYARFNDVYFKHISEKCSNPVLVEKVKARIILQSLL